MLREDLAQQGVSGTVIDHHWKHLTNLAAIAFKDDDAITVRAAGQSARPEPFVLVSLRASYWGPSTKTSTVPARRNAWQSVFHADRVLDRQQFGCFARCFTSYEARRP